MKRILPLKLHNNNLRLVYTPFVDPEFSYNYPNFYIFPVGFLCSSFDAPLMIHIGVRFQSLREREKGKSVWNGKA